MRLSRSAKGRGPFEQDPLFPDKNLSALVVLTRGEHPEERIRADDVARSKRDRNLLAVQLERAYSQQ